MMAPFFASRACRRPITELSQTAGRAQCLIVTDGKSISFKISSMTSGPYKQGCCVVAEFHISRTS